MPFNAEVKEIENGFIVSLWPKVGEFSQTYASTFEGGIAALVTSYKKWCPKPIPIPPAFSKTLQARHQRPPQTAASSSEEAGIESAARYTKLCGLVKKELKEFVLQFNSSFPVVDLRKTLEAAHCTVVDGKVVFTGGN